MKRTSGDTGAARGFTLIELLVAFSIVAMLTAILASGFSAGLSTWQRSNRAIDDFRARQTTMAILREQIAGALPAMYRAEDSIDRRLYPAFAGERQQMRFISRVSFATGADGVPRWIEMQWSRDFGSATGRLHITERPVLTLDNRPGMDPYWSGAILESADFRFEFLRRARADRPAEWLGAWRIEEEVELPAAVRIEFPDDRNGGLAQWVFPLEQAPVNWGGFAVE